jgi:choline dehydrogenase-like flavoprotein
MTTQFGLPTFKVPTNTSDPLNSPEFQDYLAAIRSLGVHQLRLGLFCAHQMGSCRLSAHPSRGPVNPYGETWEIQNLHVADASLFPSASGANPMLTTFSVAYSIAQFMKQEMKESGMVQSAKL